MTIGQTLAEAREKAGMSVEQVAAATRIRRTLVMGIERDDFSACGGDFYARGHVRTIAQTVGADPQPLLAEFDAARPGAGPPRATDVFESETAARPERRGPNWSAAMAVALVLVLGYGVVQVFFSDGERGTFSGGPARIPSSSGSGPASAPASPSATPDNS
ncbi:MAG: helix-turn-helix domain-containing protein, partial [Actinomycetes bacterium]